MKATVLFSFGGILVLQFFFAQSWKDSLLVARSFYKQGKYTEAYSSYKSVKKLAPATYDFSDEIGQAAYKANLYADAEKLYDKSGGKYAPPFQKAKTYHNLGNSMLKQKKYKEAIEAYRESLRNNPVDEETRYNLAKAMMQQKQAEDKAQKNSQHNKQKSKNEKQDSQEEKKNQGQQKEKQQDLASQKPRLNDKKTDRMLDELMKKEMETKKKMDDNRNKSSHSNSGIDW